MQTTDDASIIMAQLQIVESQGQGWHVYPKDTDPKDFPWIGFIMECQGGYVAYARGPVSDVPLGPSNTLEAAAVYAFRVFRLSL